MTVERVLRSGGRGGLPCRSGDAALFARAIYPRHTHAQASNADANELKLLEQRRRDDHEQGALMHACRSQADMPSFASR